MSETLEAQLERVQQAIARIETTGEDVSYDGKRVVRSDIDKLYAREKDLMRRIKRSAHGGGIRVRGGVPI